jgi:hypothetical protein
MFKIYMMFICDTAAGAWVHAGLHGYVPASMHAITMHAMEAERAAADGGGF